MFRGENTNDEFRYLKRENGTTQNISTGGGTLIATYTFTEVIILHNLDL